MKTTAHIVLIAFTGLLFSCKKEIKIDLQKDATKMVIEAAISNDNVADVNITQTTDFNNPNEFPEIHGAEISLSDNAGNSETLTEVAPGKYRGTKLIGVPGRTYFLNVKADGKTYSAMSTMPFVTKLDTVVGREESFMGQQVYNAYPIFKDKAGEKNFYRLIEYLNKNRMPGSVVIDDQFGDGNYNIQPISIETSKVKDGDTLEIEMQNIDAVIFEYFESMSHTEMGSNAPANPVTNVQGGALGYFSAHTTQKKMIIVKK